MEDFLGHGVLLVLKKLSVAQVCERSQQRFVLFVWYSSISEDFACNSGKCGVKYNLCARSSTTKYSRLTKRLHRLRGRKDG